MFWRHHCYSDCHHHRTWVTFRRGMVAMFVLAFAVLGILDYPHGHHLHRASTRDGHTRSVARSRWPGHHRPGHAHEHHPRTPPKPATRHRAQHSHPGSHRREAPAGSNAAAAGRGLTWTGFRGIQLPASADAGPRHARGGLAWGFTDTQQGALLAAVNIGVRTAAGWGPAVFRPTITGQVTGPGARALLAADIRAYAQARRMPGGQPSQPAAVEEAYRFGAYTPRAATIDVVTGGLGGNGNPVLVATRLRVIWRRGDWRLVAPPAGRWANASAEIFSLAGYTIFPDAG